jgi:hypothetical protein
VGDEAAYELGIVLASPLRDDVGTHHYEAVQRVGIERAIPEQIVRLLLNARRWRHE